MTSPKRERVWFEPHGPTPPEVLAYDESPERAAALLAGTVDDPERLAEEAAFPQRCTCFAGDEYMPEYCEKHKDSTDE